MEGMIIPYTIGLNNMPHLITGFEVACWAIWLIIMIAGSNYALYKEDLRYIPVTVVVGMAALLIVGKCFG